MTAREELNRCTADTFEPLRRDTSVIDENLLFGAKLIRDIAPTPRSEVQKRRVLTRVRAAASSKRQPRRHVALMGFALVLIAAASSATVLRYFPAIKQQAASGAPSEPTRNAGRPRAALPTTAPNEALVREQEPEPSAKSEASQALEPTSRASSKKPTRARFAAANSSATTQTAEADAKLLLEALRARQSGDPERVSKLADEYRRKQPSGTLQEEALILSLEAAVRAKKKSVPALAREYLQRFPNGRFRAQAERALQPSRE